ncbi:3',5'-cyclic AMP phosphodiesterase CpdA [Yoonia maricola]|uniref:3',5'-cyclic AMP phosphodiesterase CpdA n=1 Tax=Yoonia maricola TaxID=420999 RepID=A0A2M8WKD6_9RHOB|nr:phosphodiesterase [Yoonia maricola]PJI91391.1 3',5'-cyclic AMP phosphodiesterase CpdA [Yoonia maricola]
MTKIIWMSDPHLQAEGTIDGLDPRKRLDAAIAFINAHHADADFAVLTGDLVGDDIAGDYAAIAQHLAVSHIPIHPLMGNNDDRAGFRASLALPETAMPGFVQYRLDMANATYLFLDTHKVGSHAGQFCAARQAWLDDALGKSPGKPAYIFMHHPPLALGLPKQDEIMLEDAAAFLDLMTAHNNVKHLFMGHVHRPTAGTVRGIPFATLGAVSFQAPGPRPAWDWDSFKPAKEAPQLGVLLIEDETVVLQYTQFCEYAVGVEV